MFHEEQIISLPSEYDNRRGELNAMTKLTAEQVKEIRAVGISFKRGRRGHWSEFKGRPTHKELGQKYGVAASTISGIINRVTWRHV